MQATLIAQKQAKKRSNFICGRPRKCITAKQNTLGGIKFTRPPRFCLKATLALNLRHLNYKYSLSVKFRQKAKRQKTHPYLGQIYANQISNRPPFEANLTVLFLPRSTANLKTAKNSPKFKLF